MGKRNEVEYVRFNKGCLKRKPTASQSMSNRAFKNLRIRQWPNKALQLTFDPSPKPALRAELVAASNAAELSC